MALPLSRFGRTGHRSTRTIFGAAALGGMSQESADRTLAYIHERGVNHIDTAAGYGHSEDRLKPFLAEHRDEFFLATKTGERRGDAARTELERSLDRLGVDHVDLIQLHNLVDPDDWNTAHGAGGAVAALAAARDEGLARFVGITGHGSDVVRQHLRSLERAEFDSVLFPYNFTMLGEPGYRDEVDRLLTVCSERGVAVQTIKSIARRRWATESEREFSWYEPLGDADAIDRAVRYVLSNDRLFLITSSDARLLPATFDAAETDLSRPSDEEMTSDVDAFAMRSLFNQATPTGIGASSEPSR